MGIISSPDRAALEHGDLEDLLPPSFAANGNGTQRGANGALPPLPTKSPSSISSPLDLLNEVLAL